MTVYKAATANMSPKRTLPNNRIINNNNNNNNNNKLKSVQNFNATAHLAAL